MISSSLCFPVSLLHRPIPSPPSPPSGIVFARRNQSIMISSPPCFPPSLSGWCNNIRCPKRTKGIISHVGWRCRAISQSIFGEDIVDLVHDTWIASEAAATENIRGMIDEVRRMMASMGDGEISSSAYDTAWVSLVKDIHGSDGPRFPSSLQWIAHNQLHDGSWGDHHFFSIRDRVINTLACVVALRSWNICPESFDRGMSFLRENMQRLEEEDDEHMLIGFETTFPSLVEIAKELGLELPYDDPALQHIYSKRNRKLQKIPKEEMHKVPTTLLLSLEGVTALDWSRLLRFQSSDGSFMSSLSSTAYAFMQTRDDKCLAYLQNAVDKFHGGVPFVYPVDLFEHIWVVDRLERLGISQYFEAEIKTSMDYVNSYWRKDGIGAARTAQEPDIDDTAMGFRLLRLHGYNVSPDAFRHFEREGEFVCYPGQLDQSVTAMYNLNRAAQVAFPDEEILNRAKVFSNKFLREKRASGQLLDKWVIPKDLHGEVGYALDVPWYASLPRVETRLYVEQYGGGNDVWIGKILYRMPYVNNDVFLELAKSDYNRCQALHQLEWLALQRWHAECEMVQIGVNRDTLLTAYFLAAASIFEPERASERLGWTKTAVLAEVVSSYLCSVSCSADARQALLHEFSNELNGQSTLGRKTAGDDCVRLAEAIRQIVNCIASDTLPASDDSRQSQQQQQQQHMRQQLTQAWKEWIERWRGEGEEEEDEKGHMQQWQEGRDEIALLIVRTLEVCTGRLLSGDDSIEEEYERLARRMCSVCHRLRCAMMLISQDETEGNNIIKNDKALEAEVQELVQCVLQGSGSLDNKTSKTFLTVTKSFYYAAHCPPTTLNSHIAMVLFQRVV